MKCELPGDPGLPPGCTQRHIDEAFGSPVRYCKCGEVLCDYDGDECDECRENGKETNED